MIRASLSLLHRPARQRVGHTDGGALDTAFLSTAPAQAGSLGKFIAAGIVGSAIASNARSEPSYCPSRDGFDGGCGFRPRPVFDEFGRKVGMRKIPEC